MGARPEWQPVCAALVAASPADAEFARGFLEQQLTPYRIVRVTGRKRETRAWSRATTSRCCTARASAANNSPLHSTAAPMTCSSSTWPPSSRSSRASACAAGSKETAWCPITAAAATREAPGLAGHEIVWIDNVLDAFMLEVQGSGRVQLTTGETIRLQYADQNGQPYRSIGRYLADQGVMTIDQVNMPAIRNWLAANPGRVNEVLDSNPSVVFFSEAPLDDPSIGPKGRPGPAAHRRPVDCHRSEIPAARRADVPLDHATRKRAAPATTGGRAGHRVARSADPCAPTCSSALAPTPAARPAR